MQNELSIILSIIYRSHKVKTVVEKYGYLYIFSPNSKDSFMNKQAVFFPYRRLNTFFVKIPALRLG